ncbi:MAG: hypothetical protein N2379_05295 [Verrucomicrobiae bacterium]|nr:hypothetical protein [Verrucomicrobiae bacterium]
MRKNITMVVCSVILVLIFCHSQGAESQAQKCEDLYQRWHELVAADPLMDVPFLFSTNGSPPMTVVLAEIYSNRFDFAYWLCERMATNQYPNMAEGVFSTFYKDLLLLGKMGGICLIYPLLSDESPGFLERNFRKFQQDWKAGKYKDPSKEIRELCESRLAEEKADKLDPDALLPLRRYGIFGLPELTRQMKQHNSKHAFAAYLIITDQGDAYREYLSNSNQQFTNVEAKLKHVKAWFEGTKQGARGAEPAKLMENISKALAE